MIEAVLKMRWQGCGVEDDRRGLDNPTAETEVGADLSCAEAHVVRPIIHHLLSHHHSPCFSHGCRRTSPHYRWVILTTASS